MFALSDTPPIISCVVPVDVAPGSLLLNWTAEMRVWVRVLSFGITRGRLRTAQLKGGRLNNPCAPRFVELLFIISSLSGSFARWPLADHLDVRRAAVIVPSIEKRTTRRDSGYMHSWEFCGGCWTLASAS